MKVTLALPVQYPHLFIGSIRIDDSTAVGKASATNRGIKNLFTKKELIAPYCRSTFNYKLSALQVI